MSELEFGPPERITFSALEAWSYPLHKVYQYAFLPDDEIADCLKRDDLSSVRLEIPWHSEGDSSSTKADNPIHVRRIAKLVQSFQAGATIEPICIDAAPDQRTLCGFCVPDGHHRLRALLYMKRADFLACLRGDAHALEELRHLTRTHE